jgi:hypothetical protein
VIDNDVGLVSLAVSGVEGKPKSNLLLLLWRVSANALLNSRERERARDLEINQESDCGDFLSGKTKQTNRNDERS